MKQIQTHTAPGPVLKVSPERTKFVLALQDLIQQAGRLELYATMQCLGKAVQKVGWEMAGMPEVDSTIKAKRRRAHSAEAPQK